METTQIPEGLRAHLEGLSSAELRKLINASRKSRDLALPAAERGDLRGRQVVESNETMIQRIGIILMERS